MEEEEVQNYEADGCIVPVSEGEEEIHDVESDNEEEEREEGVKFYGITWDIAGTLLPITVCQHMEKGILL